MKTIERFYLLFIYFVILSGILTAQSVISQYSAIKYIGKEAVTVLDSAKLRITYSLNYVPDSLKPQQNLKDRKTLLIGDKINYFYSYYLRLADSALTADFDKGKNSAPIKPSAGVQGEGGQIYTYPATKERTVVESITDLSTYRYQETVENLQWELCADTCTILSYPCLKAITRFRGRDWTIWFTMDIPIDAGPWKLCGLPGLIMKASDSKGHYVFECIGIEQLVQKKEPVIIRKEDYTDCTRIEYMKAQKRFYENYVNALLALGFTVFITDNNNKIIETLSTPNKKYEEKNVSWMTGVNIADRNRKIPYNPIELE
jgi:GLPGLI family protein